jgi:hypothetical protein
MKNMHKNIVFGFILALGLFTQRLDAGMVSPYISAQSTATLITDGEYTGWYKYQLDVNWNLNKRFSQWDLILKPGCAASDHIIVFPCPAGYSSGQRHDIIWGRRHNITWGRRYDVTWLGIFKRNGDRRPDPIFFPRFAGFSRGRRHDITWLDPDILDPVIIYKTAHGRPGKSGSSTFFFISNIIPEYDTYEDVVVAKAGCHDTYGTLTGDYPSCTIIPEPATILLLGSGLVILFGKKQLRY